MSIKENKRKVIENLEKRKKLSSKDIWKQRLILFILYHIKDRLLILIFV